MNAPLLELREVRKGYSAVREVRQEVFEHLDISIARGERIAVVGPNGSGKTTFIRMLLGLEQPDAGVIVRPIDGLSVSYVPQDYRNALFPWLGLRKNLRLAFERSTLSEDEVEHQLFSDDGECRKLLDAFRGGFDLDKFPYQLSGGEQQIFLLVRALLTAPNLLILDEPLSAIDFGRKRLILQFLGQWLHEHRPTFLFTSHDFEDAVMLADRVLVLGHHGVGLLDSLPVKLSWPRTLDVRGVASFHSVVESIITLTA